VRIITTEHSTNNKRRNYFFLNPIERFIYSKYDKVVSISGATQHALWQTLKIKESDRFVVIENGINIRFFSDCQRYNLSIISPLLNNESKILIMVAGFNEAKDHKTMIKAMLHLPKEFVLMFVGAGPLMEKVQALVKRLHLDKRIVFLGFRKDVASLVKSSYISVLSSNWEGFGLVAIEAMAAGIPVIASDVSGLRETVQDAGILFSAGDEISLANAIDAIDKDEVRRDAVILMQKRRAANYDIKRSAHEYIQLYASLMIKDE
jgi:glycosyltransferase involved in cell wall biosynthesis